MKIPLTAYHGLVQSPKVQSKSFFCTFILRQIEENNKKCTSKDCLKLSGLINWIGCDCSSSWYQISCVSLSDSKKTQWFQCPLSMDVKSVNKATIGNDLVLNNYVNTAISNVQVLKRVPKDSRVPWWKVCRTK